MAARLHCQKRFYEYIALAVTGVDLLSYLSAGQGHLFAHMCLCVCVRVYTCAHICVCICVYVYLCMPNILYYIYI